MENLNLEALISEFYQYFLDLYKQEHELTDGSSDPFLAFLPIGAAVSAEELKLNPTDASPSPQLTTEWMSMMANEVPDVDGTNYQPTSRTVDGMFQLLLEGSQPLNGSGDNLFFSIKTDARRDFDAEIGSMRSSHSFRPVVASPANWADPAATEVWSSKSFKVSSKIEVREKPGTSKPVRLDAWKFRVLPKDLTPVLKNPAMLRQPLKMSNAATATLKVSPATLTANPVSAAPISAAPVQTRSALASPSLSKAAINHAAISHTAVRARPVSTAPVMTAKPLVFQQFQLASAQSLQLAENAEVKHCETTELTLSFEYCLVSLKRPWLNSTFLSLKNWYVPGTQAGEFSAGSAGRSDSGDDALLEALPKAALLVRNLDISASWTQSDRSVLGDSVSFGPFNLIGSSVNETSGSVRCPGMQIAAWVCEPLPLLPPTSAPAQQAETG